jgi:hypothetical protein
MAGAIPDFTIQQPNYLNVSRDAMNYQDQMALRPDALAARQAELQKESALAPLDVQAAQQKSALGNIDYANQLVAQAARAAQMADPADAPQIWDDAMQKAAAAGSPNARQYIGHYRPDLAEKVVGTFGTQTQGSQRGAGAAAGGSPATDPMAVDRAVAQMSPDVMQKGIVNMNRAISGFNNIKDEQSWNDELDQLRQAGIPVETLLPSTEWNPMNYAAAYKAVQSIAPYRDAIARRLAISSTGMNPAAPPPMYEPNQQYIGIDPNTKQPVYHDVHGGPDTLGQFPVGPKPSASTSNFLAKQQAWLAVHPNDDSGALEFANGKRNMDPAQMRLGAQNAASRELANLALTPEGMNIADPQTWVKNRTEEIYNSMQSAQAPAPAASPAPSQLPARAMQAVKAANGKPVRFNNGHSYVWKNGKAVAVQ